MLAHEMKLQWMVLGLFMVLSKWQHCAAGDQLVPCYFIFGDSLADNGNNNKLQTLAKVDYAPYGIDFRNGPTGRFCNGLTVVDIIGTSKRPCNENCSFFSFFFWLNKCSQ